MLINIHRSTRLDRSDGNAAMTNESWMEPLFIDQRNVQYKKKHKKGRVNKDGLTEQTKNEKNTTKNSLRRIVLIFSSWIYDPLEGKL